MTRRRFTRRAWLAKAGLGLSALWLPLFGRDRSVSAALPDQRKLVFVYAEAGWTSRFFKMRPPWAPPEWSEYELYAPEFSLVPDELE